MIDVSRARHLYSDAVRLSGSLWSIDGLTPEDLVGGSTLEGAVRHDAVALLDVEGDKTLDRSQSVKAIQEQPGLLRLPPQRFELRVGTRQSERDGCPR